MKGLIAFFSHTDASLSRGVGDFAQSDATEIMAQRIQALTDADIFKIEVAEGQGASSDDELPGLKSLPYSMDDYDIIYLGFPHADGEMPRACAAFLDSFDMEDRYVAPFCVHEGDSMQPALDELHERCPEAEFITALEIHRDAVNTSSVQLEGWVRSIPL